MEKESAAAIDPKDRQFMGHPIGLWVLFTTEMWERFCYYGMRAFLVLYLMSTLTSTNPGFGWSEKGAYTLYGWFTGLVYFFPLFGGLIADRLIGQHRSVLLGGILIALGELSLWATEIFRVHAQAAVTLETAPGAFITFFLGLALITVGTGFFKPCISVMVGQLYGPDDNRRDAAFTYFYMGINVGAFLAPFVAGTVAEKFGWHWGFGVASFGMIFGLCTYSFFRPKYLGHIGMVIQGKNALPASDSGPSAEPKPAAALSRKEIDRIAVILVLSLFSIAFWAVFEQAGSSLTTFAKRDTNRVVPTSVARHFTGAFLPNEDESDAQMALEETKRNLLCGDTESAEGSIKAAEAAVLKANTAREKIGLDPIALTVPSLNELTEQAKAEEARIAERAKTEGRSENEIMKEESAEAEKTRLANLDPAKTVWTFPSTWYQSVNAFWIVALGPIFAGLWSFLGKRNLEPSTPVKFGIGLLVLSVAFLFMIGGAIHAVDTAGNAAAYWLLATYICCTLGELCLSPVGLSMVTRLAPPRYASFLMGFWFISSAVAGYLSGSLAAILGAGDTLHFCFKKGLADYFLIMAIIPCAAGLIMFAIAPLLRRMMHED